MLNTIDRTHVDQPFSAWGRVATGDLLHGLDGSRTNDVTQLANAGTSTTATVKAAAVSELDDKAGTARVLAAVDVTVVSLNGPTDHKRS